MRKKNNGKNKTKTINTENKLPLQSNLEESKDGTIWKLKQNSPYSSGRRSVQNILKEKPGLTSYSKRNVSINTPMSSWRLFINYKILNIINEIHRSKSKIKLNYENWSISFDEMDAFIAVLYIWEALAAKGIFLTNLWLKTWGHNFLPSTINQNRYLEIIRYMSFDLKFLRSERLKHIRFALISDSVIHLKKIVLCVTSQEKTSLRMSNCFCQRHAVDLYYICQTNLIDFVSNFDRLHTGTQNT